MSWIEIYAKTKVIGGFIVLGFMILVLLFVFILAIKETIKEKKRYKNNDKQ